MAIKKSAVVVICMLALSVGIAYGQDEKAQIKSVIERETDSFFNVDRAAWEATWMEATYAYWSLADSTGGSFVLGTENIRKNFNDYFRTAKPSSSKIERKWLEIRVYNHGAYALFTQIASDDVERVKTSEMRVLEKDKDGKWKIVCLGSTAL